MTKPLALAIHDETDGNPFFLREVLRHLVETGGIAERDGRWAATVDIDRLGIPEGVATSSAAASAASPTGPTRR